MFFIRLKEKLKLLLSLLVVGTIALTLAVLKASPFLMPTGKTEKTLQKEYYLYSASSKAEIKKQLSLSELNFLTGQSLFVPCEGEEQSRLVEKFKSELRAKVLFEETCAGVTSFYCHSGTLGSGIVVRGREVNLHIAVSGEGIRVGVPLLFGGY